MADGVLLNIKRRAINEACRNGVQGTKTYFRIRIYLGDIHQKIYVKRVPIPDRLFQSGSEEVEYIDFRLNEARTLPEQVEAAMQDNDYDNITRIKLIAFLTAIPVQSQLASSSAPSHKLRLLEHDLWSGYVPSGIPNGMVVHHWKKQENSRIADFSAFVKMQTRKTGRYTLGKYVAVAFLFGILGNLTAAAIQSGLEKLFMGPPNPTVEPAKSASDPGKPVGPITPPQNPVRGGR